MASESRSTRRTTSGAVDPSASALTTLGPPGQGREDDALAWPVGAVSERLGISAATLRTWDRRYGIGPSQRTEGGHRRYLEEDIRRVRVMARFTARGVPAESAARVALAMDSERLHIETEQDTQTQSDPGDGAAAARAICSAALGLDAAALSGIVRRALRERELVDAWTEVFAPALRMIGEQWGNGSLGVESEHLASEVLVAELRGVIAAHRPRHTGADVVLASADEEHHYLPLLALEAVLARHGLAAASLGARVPTTSLAEVLTRRQPSRVFLWASMQRPDDDGLWAVLESVDWPLTVVVGGPGWPDLLPQAGGRTATATVTRAGDLASASSLLLAAPA